MILPLASQWRNDNLTYLTAAVNLVRQMLESYIENIRNQSLEKVLESRREMLECAATLPSPPALAQLCASFELSEFEQFVLLLCAARELEPTIGRLCAEVQGNEQLTFPTIHLALKVLPSASYSAFTIEAPLRRWQLIEIEPSSVFSFSPLRIDECLLLYLLGEKYSDRHLSGIINPVPIKAIHEKTLPPSHQLLAEQIAGICHQANSQTPNSIIQLCGNEASAMHAIASTACALAERHLSMVSLLTLASTQSLVSSPVLKLLYSVSKEPHA